MRRQARAARLSSLLDSADNQRRTAGLRRLWAGWPIGAPSPNLMRVDGLGQGNASNEQAGASGCPAKRWRADVRIYIPLRPAAGTLAPRSTSRTIIADKSHGDLLPVSQARLVRLPQGPRMCRLQFPRDLHLQNPGLQEIIWCSRRDKRRLPIGRPAGHTGTHLDRGVPPAPCRRPRQSSGAGGP
jgi:hypothetical protein